MFVVDMIHQFEDRTKNHRGFSRIIEMGDVRIFEMRVRVQIAFHVRAYRWIQVIVTLKNGLHRAMKRTDLVRAAEAQK